MSLLSRTASVKDERGDSLDDRATHDEVGSVEGKREAATRSDSVLLSQPSPE